MNEFVENLAIIEQIKRTMYLLFAEYQMVTKT